MHERDGPGRPFRGLAFVGRALDVGGHHHEASVSHRATGRRHDVVDAAIVIFLVLVIAAATDAMAGHVASHLRHRLRDAGQDNGRAVVTRGNGWDGLGAH